MSNIDRRLAQLEEATAAPKVSYSVARERAQKFWGDLHKIYGEGTEPEEESISELTEIIMAGKYEAWVHDQVHSAYAQLEREHAQQP